MNMKRTIAAVAATAMAVSAMAVTVSADTTLTYNLVETHKEDVSAKVTLQATVSGAGITALKFTDTDSKITPQTITLKITDESDTSVNKTYVYSGDANALNYNSKFNMYAKTFDFAQELAGLSSPKVQVTVECNTTYESLSDINNDLGTKVAITPTGGTGVTPTIVTAYTAKSSKIYKQPFKTGPGMNENIAWWLQNKNCRNEDNPYRNVLPTINDALANYDSATFVFTTATAPIGWVVQQPKGTSDPSWFFGYSGKIWGGTKNSWSEPSNGYSSAVAAAMGDESLITAIYAEDWYGDSSYMSFTQHLYGGTTNFYGAGDGWAGYDNEPLGIDWAGENLFGGALVINENLTMTLSDVDYFEWTNTTLSFDWEAILDSAMTSNAYATYVQSIKLATSVNWYWDKMEIILTDSTADDASADAGTESEEETLDETDTDETEEITDEEVFDEDGEPTDEEEEVVDIEEETPVQDNPGTGNAPVALAVIPVALAAAAVVAKKKN